MFLGHIVNLRIYPIKSCGGFDVAEFTVSSRGPELDRQWMVVDENGKFITQRQCAEMALIRVERRDQCLWVSKDGAGELLFADLRTLEEVSTSRMRVKVWGDEVDAARELLEVDEWFSDALHRHVNVVRADKGFARPKVITAAQNKVEFKFETSFADTSPFLLINRETLRSISRQCGWGTIDENRFRPNVVIDGGTAFDEERASAMRLGNIFAPAVEPCERCTIITVDQHHAQKTPKILSDLAKYRRERNEPLVFGMCVAHQSNGYLAIGDTVTAVP